MIWTKYTKHVAELPPAMATEKELYGRKSRPYPVNESIKVINRHHDVETSLTSLLSCDEIQITQQSNIQKHISKAPESSQSNAVNEKNDEFEMEFVVNGSRFRSFQNQSIFHDDEHGEYAPFDRIVPLPYEGDGTVQPILNVSSRSTISTVPSSMPTAPRKDESDLFGDAIRFGMSLMV